MKQFILLEIFAIVLSYVSLDQSQHCDCTELSQNECKLQPYWCSWSNDTCISHNQNCENLNTSTLCQNQGYHCTWDSKNLNCSSYECSNINSQYSCLTKKCYWFNETCSDTFTQCEDYSTTYCSYLSSQDCVVNDTKCVLKEFPANCTDDANCIEDFTSAAKTHKCVLKESKCYEIDVSNPCPTFNDSQTICESYSQCFYFDATTTESTEDSSICRQKQCPDMIDQTTCEGLVALDKSLKVLCEWVDDKCQNMEEATKYTEDNCFKSTLYNYKWNGVDKKCEQCKSLIANTPVYESINNNTNETNSTNTTINDTVIYSTDPFQINLNKRCSCRQFETQINCEDRDGCQWSYDSYTCIPWDAQCSSMKSQSKCQSVGCEWKYSSCEKFISCSDYGYYSNACPLHRDCLYDGQYCTSFTSCQRFSYHYCPLTYGCEVVQRTYGSYCESVTSCSSYTKENCQGKYLSRNNPCYLANDGVCKTKFTLVNYQICEDFDDSRVMCQSMKGCAYVNDKCIKGKCYQFPEDNCYHQRNGDGIIEMCDWNQDNNQCDYAKLSETTSFNCVQNWKSASSYYSACQECADLEDTYYTESQSTFGQHLTQIILAILIIIN